MKFIQEFKKEVGANVDKGYIVSGLLLTFGGVHGWIY